MMEYTKEELFSLINEAKSEVDEMAQKKMGLAKFRPIYVEHESGEIVIGKKKFLKKKPHDQIGWMMLDEIVVIYTCKDVEYEQFFERNQQLVEKLDEKFGPNAGFTQNDLPCGKPRVKPMELVRSEKYADQGTIETPDMRYGTPKSSYTARTWILRGGNFDETGAHDVETFHKRGLYDLINNFFGSGDVALHLAKCGIPSIKAGDVSREFQNAHGEISNNKIEYATHHYFLYDTVEDFIKSVFVREQGDSDEILRLSSHLARLYIKQRPKWDPRKMSKQEYLGKTEKYMLNKYGLQEMNPELTVKLDFKINGSLNLQSKQYFWTIVFMTRFGEKTKEQFGLKNFSVDKDIVVKRTVRFNAKHQFDDKHPVLFQPQIYAGLIDAMKEMKNNILAINPLSSVDLIKKDTQFDLSQTELSEAIEAILSDMKNSLK